MIKDNALYTKTDEWALIEGKTAKIGISSYAAMHLGDIVFLELPTLGKTLTAGETFGAIESVKSASDLYSPLSGKVIAINDTLVQEPQKINDSPFDAWMIEIELSNPTEAQSLLSVSDYESQLE